MIFLSIGITIGLSIAALLAVILLLCRAAMIEGERHE